MDVDTIVCNPLDEIIATKADMAMVPDCHGKTHMDVISQRCKQVGFDSPIGLPYFNSGVQFVRDTTETRRFCEAWRQNWQQSVSRGVPFDQPALCQTNGKMGYFVQPLPDYWNCMIPIYEGLLHALSPQARVIHYFNENKSSVRSFVYSQIRRKGGIKGWLRLLTRYPRTVGVTFFAMGDMELIKQALRHNPFSKDGVGGLRYLQFLLMLVVSKILYLSNKA